MNKAPEPEVKSDVDSVESYLNHVMSGVISAYNFFV